MRLRASLGPTWSIGLTLSLGMALGMSACGSKGQSIKPLVAADIVKTVNGFEYQGERFDETSEQALDMLGLWESDTISWDSREGADGNYSYKGVKLPNGSIASLTLNDVHMRGTLGPFFSSVDIQGLEYLDETGSVRTRLEKGQVNFTTVLHNHINNKVRFVGIEDLFDDLSSLDAGPLFTGSGYFDGLTATLNSQIKMEADFVGWYPGLEAKEVSFLARDVKVYSDPDAEPPLGGAEVPPLDVKAALVSLKNFELDALSQNFGIDVMEMNPFDSDYDSVILKDISAKLDTAYFSLPALTGGIEGNLEKRYTSSLDIPSMSLTFSGPPSIATLAPAHAFYERSGYDRLELSVRSKADLDVKNDRVDVNDMRIEVKDGAVLNMDYELTGVSHFYGTLDSYTKQIEEARIKGSVAELPETSEIMDEAMSRLRVKNMDVALSDQSLLENVLAQMAEQQDVSIDVTRQQFKGFAMLVTLWTTDPYLSELSEDFAESAQAFVVNGGGMKFSVSPEKDFALGPALRQASAEPKKAVEIMKPLGADFEHIPN